MKVAAAAAALKVSSLDVHQALSPSARTLSQQPPSGWVAYPYRRLCSRVCKSLLEEACTVDQQETLCMTDKQLVATLTAMLAAWLTATLAATLAAWLTAIKAAISAGCKYRVGLLSTAASACEDL